MRGGSCGGSVVERLVASPDRPPRCETEQAHEEEHMLRYLVSRTEHAPRQSQRRAMELLTLRFFGRSNRLLLRIQ